MRHRGARALGLALVLGALGTGCAFWPSKERSRETVEHNAEQFSDNFQWQRWSQAAQQVHPDDRAAFLAFGSRFGDRLHVTGFEIAAVEIEDGGREAAATVVFQLYRPPSLTEQTLIDRQQWVRKGGDWYLRPALERYTASR